MACYFVAYYIRATSSHWELLLVDAEIWIDSINIEYMVNDMVQFVSICMWIYVKYFCLVKYPIALYIYVSFYYYYY